jgi:hypothetical protein
LVHRSRSMSISKPNGLARDVKLMDRRVSAVEKFVVAQHEFNVARADFEKSVGDDVSAIKKSVADLKTQGDARKGGEEALAKLASRISTTLRWTSLAAGLVALFFAAVVWLLHHA